MAKDEIFSDDPDLFASCAELLEAARGRGLTLGTAESCTGGLVSACLTAVPGSSDVVRGGVVSYAIDVKRAVLGVSDDVFDDASLGAVSAECAEQMARGARFVLGCDVAVSVTGIAGPGGEEPGKPVGTVWLGLSTPAGERSALLALEGDRAAVRHAAAARAVELLREGVVESSAGVGC